MKILILGDVMGPSGRKAVKKNLQNIIKDLLHLDLQTHPIQVVNVLQVM